VPIGLTYIHGIGRTKAAESARRSGSRTRAGSIELTDDEVLRIRELIDREYTVEGDLRRQVAMNIKRLMISAATRGLRHRKAFRSRPAHPYQRPHAQGPARPIAGKKKTRHAEPSKGRPIMAKAAVAPRLAAPRAKEHHLGRRACERLVQQHGDHHNRRSGQYDRLVVVRSQGFKGSRKSTPYAAQMGRRGRRQEAMEHGMRTLEIEGQGTGSGRESALRALQTVGFAVTSIRDVTPIPHNGCRPPKRRRV